MIRQPDMAYETAIREMRLFDQDTGPHNPGMNLSEIQVPRCYIIKKGLFNWLQLVIYNDFLIMASRGQPWMQRFNDFLSLF